MNASAQTMQLPKRWPLVAQPSHRGESYLKDARLVNCFAEQDLNTGEYWIQKRIGFQFSQTLISSGFGRGTYTWYVGSAPSPLPTAYTIVGNGANATLFRDSAVVLPALGLVDALGNWSWTETQGTTRYLIFAPPYGVNPINYIGVFGGWTTTGGLPIARGTYIVGLAYLDGTIYFMDELCQIFGSNIDDPTTFNALNVISAKKIPGTGVALVRQLSYLLALKSSSMEVFYDAGNAVGSPLLQIDGATTPLGCADRNTVQTIDGIVFYLTSNQTASPQLVRVDNLIPTVVSVPGIERLLDLSQRTGTFYSWVFKHGGHRFYGLSHDQLNITLVYDIDQKFWLQWTDINGNWFKMHSTSISNTFQHQFLHPTNGSLYVFEGDYTYPTDDGNVAPVDIYTPNVDFGTRRRKTLHRMHIRSDQTPGSILQVRHSDDDYQNWSNYRRVDLGRKTPDLNNEGTFVKRAYHFRHAAQTAFRIRSADLQMDIGTI